MKDRSNRGQVNVVIAVFTVILLLGGAGAYLKFVLHLSPGKLSQSHPKNEPLEGYVSHAEFENECSHCHAPIHCITAERCQDCHVEIARQRAEADGLHSRLPNAGRCRNCHTEHNGRDTMITVFAYENVDHEILADFSLVLHTADYQGEALTCDSCHRQERYLSETLDCLNCHIEADHAFMSEHVALYGVGCVPCHDGRDRMSDFEHGDYYLLEGGHKDAECRSCHLDQVFGGTTQVCSDCHQDPEIHAGQFGLQCDRCHTAAAWEPAFLMRHNFYLDHGSNGSENECEVCHPDSCTTHTCFGCHEHQEGAIRAGHLAEGIMEYNRCWECHPTGVSGEAQAMRQEQGIGDNTPGQNDNQSQQHQSGGMKTENGEMPTGGQQPDTSATRQPDSFGIESTPSGINNNTGPTGNK